MTTQTFELPVSDCGCFAVGEIGPDTFETGGGKPYPKFGVIVWYSTKDAARAACIAASQAHWPDSGEEVNDKTR